MSVDVYIQHLYKYGGNSIDVYGVLWMIQYSMCRVYGCTLYRVSIWILQYGISVQYQCTGYVLSCYGLFGSVWTTPDGHVISSDRVPYLYPQT